MNILPTATDNCVGTVTATTSDPLQYDTAGNYIINWLYNDGNGNLATQQQNINVTGDPAIIYNNEINITPCNGELINLQVYSSIITTHNATFKFYNTLNDLLTESNPIINDSSYQATLSTAIYCKLKFASGCNAVCKININIQSPPNASSTQLKRCSNTSNVTFNLHEAENQIASSPGMIFDYFLSQADLLNNVPILNTGNFQIAGSQQKLFVKVSNQSGCHSIAELNLEVNRIIELTISDLEQCKLTEGAVLYDLTQKQAEIGAAISGTNNTYKYYLSLEDAINNNQNYLVNGQFGTSNSAMIYCRVETLNNCPVIVRFNLVLWYIPETNLLQNYEICPGNSISISAGETVPGMSYIWSNNENTRNVTFESPGAYWVKMYYPQSSIICEKVHNFNISHTTIPLIDDILVTNLMSAENTVVIEVNPPGFYEYSIDGILFKDSNIFENVPPGKYTVYVRDQNRCALNSKDIFVVTYPRFFSPNNDGINDYWRIKYLYDSNIIVNIYDRYGKVIYSFNQLESGWDGKTNGNELPATDYWFTVQNSAGSIIFKSHFSLIR